MSLRLLSLALVIIFFNSCGQNVKQKQESPLLRSYRLIDENKVDDAISLLSDEIERKESQNNITSNEKNSELNQLKVTLASAFSKKAGLTAFEMAQSYQMAKQISSLKLTSQPASFSTATDQKITDLSKNLIEQIRLIQTLTIIPKVKNENLMYLNYAVKILNSTANLGPGDLVYSAIVKLVLVRSLIETQNLQNLLPKISDINSQCVANFANFRDYLLRATKLLLSALNDLQVAMPEKKEEILKNYQDVIEISKSVASINAAGVAIYTIDRNSLKSLYQYLGISSQDLNCELKNTN